MKVKISTFRVLEKEDFWKEAENVGYESVCLEEEESEEDEIRKMMCVPHLKRRKVCMRKILPGIDLHYSIQGEQLKENIRLNRKEAAEQEIELSTDASWKWSCESERRWRTWAV